MVKVHYAAQPDNPAKSSKARGNDIRVHFKNTVETCNAVRGMKLRRAKSYLKHVIAHKECVPFRHYRGGIGRTAQAKAWGSSPQGRWPIKSAKHVLELLRNAEANAENKGLDTRRLTVTHIQAQPAAKQRRRTYRAHGRINPFMSSPSHIEIVLTEIEKAVPKASKPQDSLAVRKERRETYLAKGAQPKIAGK